MNNHLLAGKIGLPFAVEGIHAFLEIICASKHSVCISLDLQTAAERTLLRGVKHLLQGPERQRREFQQLIHQALYRSLQFILRRYQGQ